MRIWLVYSPPFSSGEITIFVIMAANAEHASSVMRGHPCYTIERFGNHVIDVV